MTIKHIVISGGGVSIFQSLGIIQRLEEKEFLDLSIIESIYGTSAGAIFGVLLCLKFDWETINDYLIKRPWHELFKVKVENIFESYKNKGIFNNKIVEKCFKPLFDAKDIPLNINMVDFYNLTKIELHMYTLEINEYKIHDISYLTHPELKLLDAVHMSCALPIILTPICIEDKCYMDGGVITNYPLNYCIESGKNPDEILGLKNNVCINKKDITCESTILDFLLNFLHKSILCLNTTNSQTIIKNEVVCDINATTIENLNSVIKSYDKRKDLLEDGIRCADIFYSTLSTLSTFEKVEQNS